MDTLLLANDAVIMAQSSGLINSNGLEDLFSDVGSTVKTLTAFVLGIIAAITVVVSLAKSASAFSRKDMGDGVKHLGFAALGIIVAILGTTGMFALVDAINPVEQTGGMTDFLE